MSISSSIRETKSPTNAVSIAPSPNNSCNIGSDQDGSPGVTLTSKNPEPLPVRIFAGGSTKSFFACLSNWTSNFFMSTGFAMTSETPALAAETRYSSLTFVERMTIRHFRANSGSEERRLAASIASLVFHSPSMSTTSGIVANAVPSHCLNVPALVTEYSSRSNVPARRLRRPSCSSATIMDAMRTAYGRFRRPLNMVLQNRLNQYFGTVGSISECQA